MDFCKRLFENDENLEEKIVSLSFEWYEGGIAIANLPIFLSTQAY